MRTIGKTLRLLILGLWLGAAVFFGAAVAPNLFDVLRSAHLANANELAGTIVTRLLAIVNLAGFAISLVLIATYFANQVKSRLWRFGQMISLVIMAIMTGVNHWLISARMLALRAAMQAPIDQIEHDDPRHVAFATLHGLSVTAMGLAIVAGLVAFVIIAGVSLRGSSPTRGPEAGSTAGLGRGEGAQEEK